MASPPSSPSDDTLRRLCAAHADWKLAERCYLAKVRDVADRRAEATRASGEERDWLMEFVEAEEQEAAAWGRVAVEAEEQLTAIGATAWVNNELDEEDLEQQFGVGLHLVRTEWDLLDRGIAREPRM